MSVRKPREKLHGKSKASLWRNLSTDTLPNFFSTILCFVALLQCIFFFRKAVLGKLFDIWFSYKHCNFSHVCLLVKMASKTVTRSISKTLLLKEPYRSFRSIIAVIVIFLLGFHEFCCDASSVFPWCDVDNYRIPKQIKFASTLPLDGSVAKRALLCLLDDS